MHTFCVILNLCVFNGLCTTCIDSVVRVYANVSNCCNLLNIIPNPGSLGGGFLTITCVMCYIQNITNLLMLIHTYKTNVQ